MPNAEQNLKRIKKLVANKSLKDEWNKLKEAGVFKKEWAKVKDDQDEVVRLLTHALSDKAGERKEVANLIGNYTKAGINKVVDLKEAIETHAKSLAGLAEAAEPGPSGGPSGVATDDPKAAKLTTTLGKMKPLIQKALEADPGRKAELLGAVANIQAALKESELTKATQDLRDLHGMLAGAAEAPSENSTDTGFPGPGWAAAKKTWVANKKTQVAAIKSAMNELGNLALDAELPAEQVDALMKELSTYVPDYKACVEGLDAAIKEIDQAQDQATREAASMKLEKAKTSMTSFCSGPRLQTILSEFEGDDFFNPTLEALPDLSVAT